MSKQKQLYREQREKALALLGSVCADCGTVEQLEFDHKEASGKEYEIGTRFGRVKFETLLPELLKCTLRCKSCHTAKTIRCNEHPAPAHASTHGDLAMYSRYGCRCAVCRRTYSEWHRTYRLKRGLTRGAYNKAPSDHGDVRQYRRGCRCAKCRDANAAKQREQRMRG